MLQLSRSSLSRRTGLALATAVLAFPALAVSAQAQPTFDASLPVRTATSPAVAGHADQGDGYSSMIDLYLYRGSSASGEPFRTFHEVLVDADGRFSKELGDLDDGTYTVEGGQYYFGGEILQLAAKTRQLAAQPHQFSDPDYTFTKDSVAPVPAITSRLAGTGGTAAGDVPSVRIDIRSGADTTSGPIVRTVNAAVSADGRFDAPSTLDPGTYTAIATQSDDVGNTGTSAPFTFTVPTPAPIVVPAASTPTPAPAFAAPAAPTRTLYVCKSRRSFSKHVKRPSGTRLSVVARINGRRVVTTIRRQDILVRVDLRGQPLGTYTLRVSLTRTLPSGKRTTTDTVTKVDYHTCEHSPGSRGA